MPASDAEQALEALDAGRISDLRVDGLADAALLDRMQREFLAKPYSPNALVTTARMLGSPAPTEGV